MQSPRVQRLHSLDPQEKERTIDNSQRGLLLPLHDASRWKVFHRINRRARSPFLPACLTLHETRAGRPKGVGRKSAVKIRKKRVAEVTKLSYLGDAEQKAEPGWPSLRWCGGAGRSGSPHWSPRPAQELSAAQELAARPPLPLPPSRASCHCDQTCLCALCCCDFLILCSRAHTHTQPHAQATPTKPGHQTLLVFQSPGGRVLAGASASAAAPEDALAPVRTTHSRADTLAPA